MSEYLDFGFYNWIRYRPPINIQPQWSKIKLKLNEKDQTYDGNEPNPEDWGDYFENNADFKALFNTPFDDNDIK